MLKGGTCSMRPSHCSKLVLGPLTLPTRLMALPWGEDPEKAAVARRLAFGGDSRWLSLTAHACPVQSIQ